MDCETNGSVLDQLFGALADGDVAAAMACLTLDARVWHNFDDIALQGDEIRSAWEGFVAGFPAREVTNVRRSAIPGGFAQQHSLVTTSNIGERRQWRISVFVQLRDGLIAQLDEYVDRAGGLPIPVEPDDALREPNRVAIHHKAAGPTPTRDRDHALADLKEHGVCILTDAMGPAFHAEVNTALSRAAESDNQRQWRQAYEFSNDDIHTQRVWNLPSRDPVFCDLAEHELTVFFLKKTIGWPALLSSMSANITTGGSQSMIVHADQTYMPEPWDGPQGINAAWCVDDFTAENGATCYVPGSHRLNRSNRPGEEVKNLVPLEAPAGSLIVMDGRIWHTVAINHSNRRRAGIFAWYTLPVFLPQENWFLSLNPAVRQFGSETLLTLLGFRPGLMGRINGIAKL